MRLPKLFHSMYIKWTLAFVALLLIAQAMTAAFSFRAIISETSGILADKLMRKAALVLDLHDRGYEITESIMYELGDTDISVTFLGSHNGYTSYRNIISLEMVYRAGQGEFVLEHRNEPFHRVPYVLFDMRGQLVMLSPILPQNELTLFVDGIARAMVLNTVLSSAFVSAALLIIILKIRKITAATREVAKGNFNVELFTRNDDEIGELMRNFNTMTKELRQSEYLKKDFVSSVSHEFKTPITAIEGFARLLKSKDLTAEQYDEYTEIIVKETARLSNLSTNLLRLSLLDNSDFTPEASPFYIDEQLRSTILLLQRAWEEKNISFDIQAEEMLYNGNEELLSQVWINLLQNAIKFSPAGGTIAVKLSSISGHLLIEITNGGPGIAPLHKDKIFTRFYKDTKHNQDGNGLGLPIAKRIVELSKGEIGFSSEKGNTVFYVKLPK